ncbi:MAG: tetratricopeptide repeat protein [Deltaproteobacteria bacterium]|nr:tetratricopeptide repeat protein [Deltaproteobacteria bacterium]
MRLRVTSIFLACLLLTTSAAWAKTPDEDLLQAQRLADKRQYGKALDILSTLLAADAKKPWPAPFSAKLRAQVDRLCFELLMVDKPHLAIVGLRALMASGPAPSMRWAMLARAYVETGEYRKASQTLRRGLSQHPSSPELLFVRASLAGSMSKEAVARSAYASAESMLRGAAGDLEKAIAVDAQQAGIHRALGKIRGSLFVYCRATGQAKEAMKLWAQAEDAYAQAMRLDIHNPDLAYEAAELQRTAGDWVWAEELYHQAENRYRRLAQQKRGLGLHRSALDRAETCRQRRVQAVLERVRWAISRARFEEARQLLKRSLDSYPANRAMTRAMLAEVDRRARDFKAVQASLENSSSNGDAQVLLGDMFRESGLYDKARKAYQQAQTQIRHRFSDQDLAVRFHAISDLPNTSLHIDTRIGDQDFMLELPPDQAAAPIRALLEKAHALAQAAFRHRLVGPVHLKIFVNQRAFIELAGVALRPRTRGLYAYGRIMSYADPARGQAAWLDILTHELGHRYVDEMSYGRAPVWLSEGLAHWCSPGSKQTRLSDWRKTMIPWRRLEQRLGDSRGNLMARQALLHQAEHMVAWLMRRFGAERMMTLLGMLRQGLPPEQAMKNAFGQTRGVLEGAWCQELRK